MDVHEEYLELCAAAAANELSPEEAQRLKVHLASCQKCREAVKDYQTVLTQGIPALAPEMIPPGYSEAGTWSVEDAERRLLRTIGTETKPEVDPSVNHPTAIVGKRYSYHPSAIRWREVWMTFAAAIILAAALAVTLYKTGLRRGVESARIAAPHSDELPTSLEAELSDAGYERQQLQGKLADSEHTIGDLRRRLAEQEKTIQSLEGMNANEKSPQTETDRTQSRQSIELKAAQSQLTELKQNLDLADKKHEDAAAQVATLEGKVEDLSKLVRDREQTLDRKEVQVADQQEMLDHDRDIRELMGARELYMADVHDVNNAGTSRTYGRIFFTKGKSLIFYAFDLQEKAGLQNASTYQVWGRRGPDKKNARSLGIFFEDNASKKRWVMKANDPKSLQDIDAVFVTVEPNGGSSHPSSKPLLFAYLGVTPNHP